MKPHNIIYVCNKCGRLLYGDVGDNECDKCGNITPLTAIEKPKRKDEYRKEGQSGV